MNLAQSLASAVATLFVLGSVLSVNPAEAAHAASLATPLVDSELAGRPLAAYPYFEYVGTFHEGNSVSIALDAKKLPALVPADADVYIVYDRDAAQWSANPSLVDVRGVPTTVAMGLDANGMFTALVETGTLSGFAGTGFGFAFDVVLDMNQDGQLGLSDYIDGRTDAGFYIARDPTIQGPLAVTEIQYSGGTFLGQDTYYPTSIASMGALPLVVISHGNGHDYRWYDHIGFHLASYGCIVMSHQNDTMPGPETASTTTLTNTDYILANQATINGGVLNGHIDADLILFIGHSRGGEGVVRAFNRVATGAYVPSQFTASDVLLVSSICPTNFLTSTATDPFLVNYHLMYTSSDSDVTGSPSSSNSKPLVFYERAKGDRLLTYVQGAGHADFHAGGGACWCTGPNLIGMIPTHKLVLGYYLPLVKRYVEDNRAAKDYLTRMYGSFHPPGIPANVIVAKQYHEANTVPNFAIDDFQTNTSLALSSSGGLVSSTVTNLAEGLMQDIDNSFDFFATVPHNGMTNWKDSGDTARCAVFDWTLGQDLFYELEIVPGQRDLSDDTWLSLRAAQGTRHPQTDALNAPLTFTVTLRDFNGATSSIQIGSYGSLTRTYQRTGNGVGAGWANEWSSLRLRLTDFTNAGSALDLTNVVAVRLEFGATFGSARGRIGVDDIEIIKN